MSHEHPRPTLEFQAPDVMGTFMGFQVVKAPLNFSALVAAELAKARAKHGPIKGLHEGYAVLLEEVDEFWDLVKQQKPDQAHMVLELVQIAAMAQKIAEDVLCPS